MILNSPFKIEDGDVCIVGSGLGGSILSLGLASKGVNVTTIEAGGISSEHEFDSENIGQPFMLPKTRYIGVGGTSNLWHGLLAPLDERDFNGHSGGLAWPFPRSELVPFYREAMRFLTDGELELGEEDLFEHQSLFLGFKDFFVERKYTQKRPTLDLRRKLVDAHRRQSSKSSLITGARVVAIDAAAESNPVVHYLSGGVVRTARFKKVVLAAGALETPAILLRSGIGGKNVGKYLDDHPMAPLVTLKNYDAKRQTRYLGGLKRGTYTYYSIRPNDRITSRNITLMVRPSFQWSPDFPSEDLRRELLLIRDRKFKLSTLAGVFSKPRLVFDLVQYKYGLPINLRMFDLYAVAEQVPTEESCVTLSGKVDKYGMPISQVNWQVSDDDVDAVDRVFKHLTENFGSEGCAQFGLDNAWHLRFSSAAHHFGSCRMSASEDTGVLDANGALFSNKNILVCDASSIPAGGSANLGLTVAALALRMVTYLGRTFAK